MDTATKVCACCREELPLGDFGRVKERIHRGGYLHAPSGGVDRGIHHNRSVVRAALLDAVSRMEQVNAHGYLVAALWN
jgi:hypothetical protein